jgi:hypothetical protein
VNYASFLKPNVKISGDRNMKAAVTDLRDIGPYVAKIITDDLFVNKFVLCYGELLSQEEIFAKMEEFSGEKIERQYVRSLPDLFFSLWILYSMDARMNEEYLLSFAIQIPPEQLLALLETTGASFEYDFSNVNQTLTIIGLEYAYSKFVRSDNPAQYAKYLGYLDANDLYPDFAPRSFEAFAKELLDGRATKIFEGIEY